MPPKEDPGDAPARDDLAESIRSAWRWGDAWQRACAVRASRQAPTLDPQLFASGDNDDPLVRAEIAALSADGPRGPGSAHSATVTALPKASAC
jgi:hypothetical protein